MGFFQDLLKNKTVQRFINPQVSYVQKQLPRAREVFRNSLPTPQNFQRQVVQPVQRQIQPIQQRYQTNRNNFNAQHPTIGKLNSITNNVNPFKIATGQVGGKYVVRPAIRAATQAYNQVMPQRMQMTNQGKFGKFAFGNEEVGNLKGRQQYNQQYAQSKGISSKYALPLSLAMTGLAVGADATPFGSGKKQVGKEVGMGALNTLKKVINPEDKIVMNEYINRFRLGYKIDKTLEDEVSAIVKGYGIKATGNMGLADSLDNVLQETATKGREFLRTGKGKGNKYAGSRTFRDVVPGISKNANNPMYGGVAGVEVYKDKDGKTKVRFNPYKAAAGMAVMGGVKFVKGKPTGKQASKIMQPSLKEAKAQLPQTSQVLPPSQLNKKNISFAPSIAEKGTNVKTITSKVGVTEPLNDVINLKNLNISATAKNRINKEIESIKPQIEAKVGAKLTNQEAVTLAENSSKTLNVAAGREQTKQWEAALLKTRQQLAASAKSNTIDKAFIENLKNVKALATDTARKLQSFGINADPVNATPKQAILEAILKVNDNTDEILKASKGVNFDDANQATNFYRTFVKPKASDWVDLIRYNSMLSSPLTHIKNISTNALQTTLIKPIEKTLTGVVDIFSKKPTNFAGEGVAYAGGTIKSLGDATRKFADVMSGKAGLTNLDMKYIPPSTGAGTKFLSFPTKMLDGMDQFFTTLGAGGEKAALNLKLKKGIKIGGNIDELAKEKAAYTVFRQKLGNTDQGYVLDSIDSVTNIIENLRQNKSPLVSTVAKFSLPFVRTPMNIFKQGLEYSPLGFTTTVGAKNVSEQISKALIGTAVFGGSATLLGSGRLTWSEPINEKQKNEFRAAGMQPYAVKIGDKWVAYKYLGPLAFPLALTASIDYEIKNGRMDDTTSERILGALARYGTFLADQSYAKSMGDLLKAVSGDESGIARVVSNYPQQLIPLRALFGWMARIVDPNQRKISKDAGFIDKQVQMLMQNIPGLSQKLETRPDTFGNPIPNQNRVFNAFSPLSVTTENPVGKDIYQSSENKRMEARQIADLKKGQGGKTDSGKYVVKVGDEYKTFNEQQYNKYNFEKDNGDENTTYSKYSLEADRLKDDKDINGWMDKTKAYLSYYSEYIKTLDPNTSEYFTAVKRYENLLDTASKYKGYSGFTKPKKGGSGKISASSKQAKKDETARQARKKAAISSLKGFKVSSISAPSMPTRGKISGVKTITAAELARGR